MRVFAYGHFHLISIQGRIPIRLNARSWLTARPCVFAGLEISFIELVSPIC